MAGPSDIHNGVPMRSDPAGRSHPAPQRACSVIRGSYRRFVVAGDLPDAAYFFVLTC